MATDRLFRLKRGSFTRWEPFGAPAGEGAHVAYEPGDLVKNLTPTEAKEHGDRFTLVSQDELDTQAQADAALRKLTSKGAVEVTPDEEDEYDWVDFLKGSVAVIKENIEEVITDPAMLESLIRAESLGQNRKGVMTAANERLRVLARKDDE